MQKNTLGYVMKVSGFLRKTPVATIRYAVYGTHYVIKQPVTGYQGAVHSKHGRRSWKDSCLLQPGSEVIIEYDEEDPAHGHMQERH